MQQATRKKNERVCRQLYCSNGACSGENDKCDEEIKDGAM
jgi:hypothetical protein